jgi:hypothetical protein
MAARAANPGTVRRWSSRMEILLKGDLAAMLAAASPKSDPDDLRRQVKLVAGACNQRYLQLWSGAA